MNFKLTIAAAALALAAPALAAPMDLSEAVKVKYGDLDLSTDAGVAQLGRRLDHAAEQICGHVPPRGIGEQQRTAACQDNVVARANAVLAPVLAAARADVEFADASKRSAR